MAAGALAHVRVLDLTDLRGAFAGRLLADLGADVIKVEPPAGDPDRLRPPFAGGVAAPDRSLPFLYRNANKRGAVIDLRRRDAGRARLDALCARADVLLENLGAGERAPPRSRAGRGARAPSAPRARRRSPTSGSTDRARLAARAAARRSRRRVRCTSRASPIGRRAGCPGYVAHDCAAVVRRAPARSPRCSTARATGAGRRSRCRCRRRRIAGAHPVVDPARRLHAPLSRCCRRPRRATPTATTSCCRPPTAACACCRRRRGTGGRSSSCSAVPRRSAGAEWEILIVPHPERRRHPRRRERGAARRAAATRSSTQGRRLGVPIAPVNTPGRVRRAQSRRACAATSGAPASRTSATRRSRRRRSSSRDTPVALRRPRAGARARTTRAGIAPRPDRRTRRRRATGPPLAGLRVLTSASARSGRRSAGSLAELGAEVIKIESRANLDPCARSRSSPTRRTAPSPSTTSPAASGACCLDLATSARPRAGAARCARRPTSSSRTTAAASRATWGLDYDDVRRVRPDVIYVASQGYGRGGPLGEAQAFGPLNSRSPASRCLWNHADAPYPAGSALNHPDHVASKLGARAPCWRRSSTGGGRARGSSSRWRRPRRPRSCSARSTSRGRAPGGRPRRTATPCRTRARTASIRARATTAGARSPSSATTAWRASACRAGWTAEPALGDARRPARRARRRSTRGVAEWTRSAAPDEVAARAAGRRRLGHAGARRRTTCAPTRISRRAARSSPSSTPRSGPERHIGNPMRLSRTPLVHAGAVAAARAPTPSACCALARARGGTVAELVRDGRLPLANEQAHPPLHRAAP